MIISVSKQMVGMMHSSGSIYLTSEDVNISGRATTGQYVKFDGDNARVGIGTNSPGEKLEVVGNISASGLLFISASQNAGQTYGVLVRDPATGRVYHTGSYSTGGTGGGDDLGNHTATQALDMNNNSIQNVTSITATSFIGSLTGNASTATSATSATTATTATNVTLTATNATNATHYLTFTDASTGNENVRTDTLLTYNPSTNILTAGTFVGALSGNATYSNICYKCNNSN
jgi:hypothetical protein